MRTLSPVALLFGASILLSSCKEASNDGADGGAPEPEGSGGAGGGGAKTDGSTPGGGGESSREDGSVADGSSVGAGGRSSGGAGGLSSGGRGSSVDGGIAAGALPASTFLYVKAQTPDHDILVAHDLTTGEERVVTDLTEDGSDGWEIWGASISPDRSRIAIASLFGPTKADNDTGIATRRIWSLGADGSDFQRLTPVFPNTGAGKTNFTIEVSQPAFAQDGTEIIFNLGNYWYEGTKLQGGSSPWTISTAGGALPALMDTAASCSVLDPAVNPATGDVLLIHSVCVNRADQGIYLYPRDGRTAPTLLVQAGYGAGQVDPSLTPPSWVGDGSGFIFAGSVSVDRNGTTEPASSLLVYDMTTSEITPIVVPEPDEYVQAAAIAPDASAIVYCLRHGASAADLHLLDLTADPATDSPMTTDGKSCYPTF